MGIITPVSQCFSACQNTRRFDTPEAAQRTLRFKALSISGQISSQSSLFWRLGALQVFSSPKYTSCASAGLIVTWYLGNTPSICHGCCSPHWVRHRLVFDGSSSMRSSFAKTPDGLLEHFVGLPLCWPRNPVVWNSSRIAFWIFSPRGLRIFASQRTANAKI